MRTLTVSFPSWLYIDSCCESCYPHVSFGSSHMVSAHLIERDRGPELFDEVGHRLRILRLVKESRGRLLL